MVNINISDSKECQEFLDTLTTIQFESERKEIRYILQYIEKNASNYRKIAYILMNADYERLSFSQIESILRLTYRFREISPEWEIAYKKAFDVVVELGGNTQEVFFGFGSPVDIITDVKLLTTDWLKQNCESIRYFGLGFIQINIKNTRRRYHFYTPETAPTANKEEIHNHRYNFKSNILYGSIKQTIYYPVDGYEYMVKISNCQKGTPDIYKGQLGVEKGEENTFVQGDFYFLNHKRFHTVEADNCITLVSRGDTITETATILTKEKKEYCPYATPYTEEELWDIVDRMLQKV